MGEHIVSTVSMPIDEVNYLLACKHAMRIIREEVAENGTISNNLLQMMIRHVEKEEEAQKKEAADKNVNDPKST